MTEVVLPGGSVEIEKTAHLPVIPPVFDLCLVQDETGSFLDDFPNVLAQLPGLIAAARRERLRLCDLRRGVPRLRSRPVGLGR